MTTNLSNSIYESFNAKSSNTRELCEGFITSEHYNKLSGSSNTILIGPRGSGKTTLMRMLDLESLEIWDGSHSGEYRKKIKYTGVFIPTDRLWKTQYDRIKQSKFGIQLEKTLEKSFIFHVLERMSHTLSFKTSRVLEKKNKFRHSLLSKEEEAELVQELSTLWKVKPITRSLKSLISSIASKKNNISEFINNTITLETITPCPELPDGELIQIIESSISVINTYIGEPDEKWAFMFDELELAPEEVIQPLLDAMRGGCSNSILKLALSPYHKDVQVTDTPDSAMVNQDFSFINLTGIEDSDGLSFSKELCQKIFRNSGLDKPVESYFEIPAKIDQKKDFIELYEKDMTFKKYLDDNKIDPKKIHLYTEKDKLPTIRKIKFIVHRRNYIFNKNGRRASRRRPLDSYAGFENICNAMEFNPRMIIGIMSIFASKANDKNKIKIHEQIKEIQRYFNSYKSLLNTIPVNIEDSSYSSVFELIDNIAHKLSDYIKGNTFHSEPKGTLTFKKEKNQKFIEAVGHALNAGALISLNDNQSQIVDIANSRFRLSRIFSHGYMLLLTKQREIELCDLLDDDKKYQNRNTITKNNPKKAKTEVETKQMDLL